MLEITDLIRTMALENIVFFVIYHNNQRAPLEKYANMEWRRFYRNIY